MPISDQANQMAMLQQAMQRQAMQQQLGPLIQKLMSSQAQQQPSPGMAGPPGQTNPLGQGQGLGAMLGGISPMGAGRQGSVLGGNTLGINQPLPMQMPQVAPQQDPQSQPTPPLPPNPQGISGDQ